RRLPGRRLRSCARRGAAPVRRSDLRHRGRRLDQGREDRAAGMAAGAPAAGAGLPHRRHARRKARADLRGRMRRAGARPDPDGRRALAPHRRTGSRAPHAGAAESRRPSRRPAAVLTTMAESASTPQRCGLVAIVGRPNVGKSTLLNALVGQKISITSKKAQTTRHRITGVRTVDEAQFVFVDPPGFQTKHNAALNRNLNRTVHRVLSDVDVVLFVVEAGKFGVDDAKVLALLPEDKPVVLICNKLDAVHRRAELAPWLKSMQERRNFTEFVPLSAKKAADVTRLFGILKPY